MEGFTMITITESVNKVCVDKKDNWIGGILDSIHRELTEKEKEEKKIKEYYDNLYEYLDSINDKLKFEIDKDKGTFTNPFNGVEYTLREMFDSEKGMIFEDLIIQALHSFIFLHSAGVKCNITNDVYNYMQTNQIGSDITIEIIETEYELKALDYLLRYKIVETDSGERIKVNRDSDDKVRAYYTTSFLEREAYPRFRYDDYKHVLVSLFGCVFGERTRKKNPDLEFLSVDPYDELKYFGGNSKRIHHMYRKPQLKLKRRSDRLVNKFKEFVFNNIILPNAEVFYHNGCLKRSMGLKYWLKIENKVYEGYNDYYESLERDDRFYDNYMGIERENVYSKKNETPSSFIPNSTRCNLIIPDVMSLSDKLDYVNYISDFLEYPISDYDKILCILSKFIRFKLSEGDVSLPDINNVTNYMCMSTIPAFDKKCIKRVKNVRGDSIDNKVGMDKVDNKSMLDKV